MILAILRHFAQIEKGAGLSPSLILGQQDAPRQVSGNCAIARLRRNEGL